MALTPNSLFTLKERYFLRDKQGEIIEDEHQLWHRIALAIANEESSDNVEEWYEKFHHLVSTQEFLPNTPSIMNAGLPEGQLSACFVLPIEDAILNGKDGIFDTLGQAAKIHQSGGGTGFDFSRLRPKNAMVDSKQGVASGPISFASIYDKSTQEMKQGGKRKGANMMNLRVDHPDILEFIDMKMTKGVMTNFNVSVTITDAFMEALENDTEYELKHTTTGVTGKLRAKDVWEKIASNAWRSAEPGIIFIDRVNRFSPYEERIEATNPCGEQPLPPYGSCNLGSIDVSKFVNESDRDFDWDRLAECVRWSTRFLDNVIDANHYPTEELKAHALKYRNIGLGLMGWADALLKLRIAYNTEHAVLLARYTMRFVNKVSHEYSIQLAEEKGLPSGAPFPSFFTYSSPYRRNATATTEAPTGSLCIIAGDISSGIECNFSFEPYEKHVLDTILKVTHSIYERAKREGWYTKELFVTSHDISPEYHVRMQAAFQENCDSGISKTINLPKTATVEDVQEAYRLAWETGCKGITVYRDGSREGVLIKLETEEDDTFEELIPDGFPDPFACCEKPKIKVESGCETCMNCGVSKCLIA